MLTAAAIGGAISIALILWRVRSKRDRLLSVTWESGRARLEPARVRRGRGFNAVEVANLESWGIKVREDEKERGAAERIKSGTLASMNSAMAQREQTLAVQRSDAVALGRHLDAIARGEVRVLKGDGGCEHRWEEVTTLGGKPLRMCIDCGEKQITGMVRGRGTWWDMKRGVWRYEDTGGKV